MGTIKQEYRFTVKFDGSNSIPVDLLCNTLMSLQDLSNNTPIDAQFTYNVVAHKQGSFEAEIAAFASVAPILLTSNTVNFVLSSLKIIEQWLEVKKHLKGNKPKTVKYEENCAKIENLEGDILQTSLSGASILENAHANTVIINIGNIYKGHDRQAMSVLSSDVGNILKIDKKDVDYIAADVDYQDQFAQDFCETNRVLLSVTKPDIAGHSQWQIYYFKRIDAKINDTDWLNKVINGNIPIKGKMRLDADLKAVGKKDKFGIPIDNTVKYSIEKVYDEIYDSEYCGIQTKL